jgi:glycosyltransferase involved in cell wall biosynthesis
LSEDQKRVIGENGRRRVEEEFTVERMSKNLSEVYESIIH